MGKSFYSVREVMEVLGIKEAKAYQIIRKLNAELDGKGYLTVQGKINRRYFEERIGIEEHV